MTQPVIIAGAGIGGLAAALTFHQIGVPCLVFEAVRQLRPLGVGINLQPNAVRELYDLEFAEHDLDEIGLAAREWALVGRNGLEIYAEPRGLSAGYAWPQYAVHRGKLQMMLYEAVCRRIGTQAVKTGLRVVGYRNEGKGVVVDLADSDGNRLQQLGSLLIGADGLHSNIRAQMHPDQPPIHWGGAVMWRGTSQGEPIRTGASFVGLGSDRQRLVIYPISPPDPKTWKATINWIAEVTTDNDGSWNADRWFNSVNVDDFIHHFQDWVFDWLDVPALIRSADSAYENPMVDRDPVSTWHDGRVVLLGDAAHAMYPTGSNGASQAIVDARILGAAMIKHGVTPQALYDYNQRLCGPVSQLVLRNRHAGPFGLLKLVEERCGGEFDDIDTVISPAERKAFMADYKAAAGFAIGSLNKAPPTIAPGARIGD